MMMMMMIFSVLMIHSDVDLTDLEDVQTSKQQKLLVEDVSRNSLVVFQVLETIYPVLCLVCHQLWIS